MSVICTKSDWLESAAALKGLEVPVEILDSALNILHTAEVNVESNLYNIYGELLAPAQ